MNKKSPVVILGFRRAKAIQRVLKSLMLCHGISGTQIYVFMDGATTTSPEVDAARRVVQEMSGMFDPPLAVFVRERPYGCFGNVTSAVSEVVQRHGRVIVLEDDMVVSNTFIEYMNNALECYSENPDIWCINAYQSPYFVLPSSYRGDVYLATRNMTGGWATWRDRWESVDFSSQALSKAVKSSELRGKIDKCSLGLYSMLRKQVEDSSFQAWDAVCSCHMAINDLYAVEPRYSLTRNIGFGAGGLHTTEYDSVFAKQRYYNFLPSLDPSIKPDPKVLYNYARIPRPDRRTRYTVRILSWLRSECETPVEV